MTNNNDNGPDPIATNPEIMALLGLASKAALLAEELGVFTNEMERVQFIAAANDARPILARLNVEFPGLIAVPHDGVQWKDRV